VDQVVAGEPENAAYPNLVDRALAYIDENHGAIDENLLIAKVFGGGSAPTLWRPLLRTLLGHHPGISLRSDGVWTSNARQPVDDFTTEFVVVDIETTGLKPSQQRIVEVAMIRVSPHGSPLRWSSLVNPGRPMPSYVAALTGIDDLKLSDAPEFRSIAPTIVEIASDLPLIAHNIDFDLSFLNAELARCGLARLVNPGIDTLALAHRYGGEVRRLNLADVARALGIQPASSHRAMADAETTLEVFRILLSRARQQGVASIGELQRAASIRRTPKVAGTSLGRGRALLDRSYVRDVPHAPGVYIMRDADDRVLYVGKAKDLRKRVMSYYSQPLGYTRKLDGLLETLARIDVEVVGTELEALILESQLIRRYRPRFNTVQRNVEQYVYVKIDISNPWPRIVVSRDRSADGAVYFGPFKSSSRAREAVDLINDVLPLRTCRRSFADKRSYGSPCLELSLHRCAGPCVGRADPEVYRGMIGDVLAFFRGDTSRIIAHLHAKLEETVKTLDFERAARLRDRIRRAEFLAGEQTVLDSAARYGHALLVLPGTAPDLREVWYLLRGRRWAQLTVQDGAGPEDLYERLTPIFARASAAFDAFVPDHHAVDEMSILDRWMRRTPRHPALITFADASELRDAARAALAVDLATPFGDVPGGVDESASDTGGDPLGNVASRSATIGEG
jgi:DNA polymerase III epsilon subunit family exonuclease